MVSFVRLEVGFEKRKETILAKIPSKGNEVGTKEAIYSQSQMVD